MNHICVLGSGAWGTAFANLLAQNGYLINLWCYEADVANEINKNSINKKFLPNVILHKNIKATTNIKDTLQDVEYIFEAIPVQFLRSILKKCKKFIDKNQVFVTLSKGIENETFLLSSQIIDDTFNFKAKIVVISGPSFAKDLAAKYTTSFDLASCDSSLVKKVLSVVKNDYCFPVVSSDLIGVQVGGACKNVIALLIGILDSLDCPFNTKAFIFTSCMKEIRLLNTFFGGKEKTLYGLSGIGDIFLTCTGIQSRNLFIGQEIGKGKKLAEIFSKESFLPESINTVKSLYQLAQKNDLNINIISSIYKIIFDGKDPQLDCFYHFDEI